MQRRAPLRACVLKCLPTAMPMNRVERVPFIPSQASATTLYTNFLPDTLPSCLAFSVFPPTCRHSTHSHVLESIQYVIEPTHQLDGVALQPALGDPTGRPLADFDVQRPVHLDRRERRRRLVFARGEVEFL